MNRLLSKTILIAVIITLGFYSICLTALAKAPVSASKSAWSFKRPITIINSGDKIDNAVVRVQLNGNNFDYSKAKANGADLRFAEGKSLKDASLPYWIEKWNNNGDAVIWVKVPLLKAGQKLTLQMYYGNPAAEAASDGNSTFLFFDDFESGDYTKKWTNVSIGEVAEQGGVLKLKESDGEDGIITANFQITGQMIIRTLYQRGNADEHWTRAGIGGWNSFLCFGDHTDFAGTGTNYVMIYDGNSLSSLKIAPLVKAANKKITDKWRPAAFWYDGKNLNGMQDDVSVAWPMANASSKLSLRTLDNDAWDNFAFITVSPYSNGKQEATVGAEGKN